MLFWGYIVNNWIEAIFDIESHLGSRAYGKRRFLEVYELRNNIIFNAADAFKIYTNCGFCILMHDYNKINTHHHHTYELKASTIL